jgi:hypothetical protein
MVCLGRRRLTSRSQRRVGQVLTAEVVDYDTNRQVRSRHDRLTNVERSIVEFGVSHFTDNIEESGSTRVRDCERNNVSVEVNRHQLAEASRTNNGGHGSHSAQESASAVESRDVLRSLKLALSPILRYPFSHSPCPTAQSAVPSPAGPGCRQRL